MPADRRRHRGGLVALGIALVATALLLSGSGPVAASTDWSAVDLTGYRFGRLSPGSTVARAAGDQVGYEVPVEGASYGPWSFDVTADGAVWLLDEVNDRLLVWRHGPSSAPGVVRLPYRAAEDFAVAPDGRYYVDFKPGAPDPRLRYAFSASGALRWTAPLSREELFNTVLRFGPDGRLHQVDDAGWRPVVTAGGLPLPVAQQQTLAGQPLPGGRLLTTSASGTRLRAVITGADGAVVRRWRLDVAAPLEVAPSAATAAVLDGALLLPVEVYGEMSGTFRHELVVLRLSLRTGALLGRITVQGRGFFGDSITRLRVGPDGAVCELRSSPRTGIRVVRHPWPAVPTPVPTAGPTSGPTAAPPPPTRTVPPSAPAVTPSAPTAPVVDPPSTGTAAPAVTATGVEAADGWRSATARTGLVAGATVLLLAAGVATALLRHRHRRGRPPRGA